MRPSNVKWLLAYFAVVAVIVAVGRIAVRDTADSRSVESSAPESQGSPAAFSDQGAQKEESGVEVRRNASATDQDERLAPAAAPAVAQLFSAPDYGAVGYREAYEKAAAYFARYTGAFSLNMIVKVDVEAIHELIHQVESNPDGRLEGAFEVSPYSDVPCTLSSSSVRRTYPKFTPGVDDVPQDGYQIEARCETSNTGVRINISKRENGFKIGLVSSIWGSFTVVSSLGDWEYALAYRSDDATLLR